MIKQGKGDALIFHNALKKGDALIFCKQLKK